MLTDIVIVNWNSGSQLHECVNSVIHHGKGYVGRVIVVDNGSTDGSENCIDGLLDVTLIRADQNLGFGKACNLGAAYAPSEFTLFLNPDARLFSNSLERAMDYMQSPENAMVGICGVQLIDEHARIARSCARFPDAGGFVAYALGFDRVFPSKGHFMSEWDHLTTRQVDHVIGAFFLIRRRVFNALQGFDERFFLYLEDLDLSYRARQLGWLSVYFAEAQAFHRGGGTSRQVKAKRLFYSLRSRILYAFKHFNTFGAMLVLVTTLLVEPISRTFLAISRCSWSSLKETFVAYGKLFRWLPHWILNGVTR